MIATRWFESAATGHRIEIGRRRHQVEREFPGDRQYQGREQDAKMIASQYGAGAQAELRANDAAGDQQHSQHDVDRLRGDRLQDGDGGGDEDDLKQ